MALMMNLEPCPLCDGYDQHHRECQLNGKEDVRHDGFHVDWTATLALHKISDNPWWAPLSKSIPESLEDDIRRCMEELMKNPPSFEVVGKTEEGWHRAYSALFGDSA